MLVGRAITSASFCVCPEDHRRILTRTQSADLNEEVDSPSARAIDVGATVSDFHNEAKFKELDERPKALVLEHNGKSPSDG